MFHLYDMKKEAEPHITLAVHSDHQAMELGPMTKRLLKATDWEPTQPLPSVQYSKSEKFCKIVQYTTDTSFF